MSPRPLPDFSVTLRPLPTGIPALLLPVRLETRRVAGWLYIRVFPDQLFVDSHQQQLTQEEFDKGQALQSLISTGQGNTDTARDEWKELARRFGPSRAAWIVEAIRRGAQAPFAATASVEVPRLIGLPERFVFLVYKGDSLAYGPHFGALIHGNYTLLPAPTTEKTDATYGLFDQDSRWIMDFNNAVTRGLGIKIQLQAPDATANVTFSQIVAVGLHADLKDDGTFGVQMLRQFLEDHRYTDGIEFLQYGTPTNNSGQSPSGHSASEEDLLASFDYEMLDLLSGIPSPNLGNTAAMQFARALGLSDATWLNSPVNHLRHIKGANLPHNGGFSHTVRGVWGATGDYFVRSMLGYEKSYDLRATLLEHAADYARPRGQLAAIRVGNQPYGVLPASRIQSASLTDPWGWQADGSDNASDPDGKLLAFDQGLHTALQGLFAQWLKGANDWSEVPRAGMSEDPDRELLGLLGMSPHSLDYRVRPCIEQSMIGVLLLLFGGAYFGAGSSFEGLGNQAGSLNAWIDIKKGLSNATLGTLHQLGATDVTLDKPLLKLFSWGKGERLYMPLVRDQTPGAPTPEQYIAYLINTAASGGTPSEGYSSTLLYDVARRSLSSSAWPPTLPSPSELLKQLHDHPIVEYFNNVVTTAGLNALATAVGTTSGVDDALVASLNNSRGTGYREAHEVESAFLGRSQLYSGIASQVRVNYEPRLEAWFRDALDILSHRLDAWCSTLPAKRLDAMRTRHPTGLQWGAYGYLEDIEMVAATTSSTPRGKYADGGGGFIQAPSVAHASAAAMLKCAFDSHRADGGANAYATNVSSMRASRAQELIDGVHQGQDLSVLLGYQFERALHTAAYDRFIDAFRKAFPIAAPVETDTEAPAEIVAPRNVLDGRVLAEKYDANQFTSANYPELIIALGGQLANVSLLITDLVDTMDAVGDLLLYEGIFQAVQGNYERSGGALDAAAGIGKPPEVESVTTPVAGVPQRHRICVMLPAAVDPSEVGPGERASAEPRLDRWLQSAFGSFGNVGCTVYLTHGAPRTTQSFPLTLDQLQPRISALDFVFMCASTPGAENPGQSEIETRLRRHAASNLGATLLEDPEWRVALGEARAGTVSLEHAMELGRAVLDMLGNSALMTPEHLAHPDDVPTNAVFLEDDVSDYLERATTAEGLLSDQTTELESNDAGKVRDALDVCAGFGIQEALIVADDDPSIPQRAKATIAVIERRTAEAAPLLAQGAVATLGDHRLTAIAGAFKAIFGESFVALPPFTVPKLDDGSDDARIGVLDTSSIASDPDIDRVWLWLQQVAETHPRVRAFENTMMALDAWGRLRGNDMISDPLITQLPLRANDGWQALDDTELTATVGRTRGSLSTVAFLPAEYDHATAVGFIIDEWTETLPPQTITTGVSFEYNQPSSQAPQCLLLATPGNFKTGHWTARLLTEIVRDTMQLAKVRMVDLDALPSVAGAFPALFFPIQGTQNPVSPGLNLPLSEVPSQRELIDAV